MDVRKSIHSVQHKALHGLLRQVRIEARLTQAELAQRLAKPQSFVSKYESGERRLDLVEVQEICHALGVSLTSFIRRFQRTGRAKSKAGPDLR